MREIKFRAWHTSAKQMLSGSNREIFSWEKEGQPMIIYQFTGHKDSKGIDIYEGDLVTHYSSPFEVVWSSRDSKFMLQFIYNNDAEGIRQTHKDFPLDANGITVIGNIHERNYPIL